MKIWLVGLSDCEGGCVEYACVSYETAYKRYVNVQSKCLNRLNDIIDLSIDYDHMTLNDPIIEEYVSEMIKLLEPDPDKINVYPQEQPFIREIELEN